jgi:hypothetical protein
VTVTKEAAPSQGRAARWNDSDDSSSDSGSEATPQEMSTEDMHMRENIWTSIFPHNPELGWALRDDRLARVGENSLQVYP